MFENFDFTLLDDTDFKEDSVREELVVPLLRALGYSAGGPAKIVRSKTLPHPFVYIGSKRFDVKIIPDYLLHASADHRWILDAKAPGENILKGRNAEQAFSYAIHPEVRASRYALCNGRQLSIFDVSRIEPLLVLELIDLERKFVEVEQLLSPRAFTKPHVFRFKPDMGLYMWKMGYRSEQVLSYLPMGVPLIAKVEDGLYTICVSVLMDETWLAATLDFDEARLNELYAALPPSQAAEVRQALRRQPFHITYEAGAPTVNMDIRLGDRTYSNDDEDYYPFVVEKFY
jgi:hypothetical protein